MYEEFIFNVKQSAESKNSYQILVRVDLQLTSRLVIARDFCKQLQQACIDANVAFNHDIGLQCYGVTEQFLLKLFKHYQTKTFDDFNFLYNDMAGSSHAEDRNMAQLQQGDYSIAVDAAARQFREDKVLAEITVAGHDRLLTLLNKRFSLTSEWELNRQINKPKERILTLMNTRVADKADEKASVVEPVLDEPKDQNKSSTCIIL